MSILYATVRISRASPGTMSGEIKEVGVFHLPISFETLGPRRGHMFGNGTPSDWIEFQPEEVKCVDIDNVRYILLPIEKDPQGAAWRITIHSSANINNLAQAPCILCGAVKLDHIEGAPR